ncbi:unnamed protein product [Cyberlindnera jadinii]|uniref:RING-type domain-containing protein n=1 Tax=Cyberlindnera jadinii (strain ATCC 18201 / CBS 1600 / BCRC 20928 / JCM 3617 / NBRC 0987 / NRRL Y-1542) TaxID=983966 RepID=A0A0H5CEZ7_CYBJN|nr:unnamed protein product [Cyberlindnera jadinii]
MEDLLGDVNESSIFSIAPVQFQTEMTNISCLSVVNDMMAIAFKNGKLFRIDLNNPSVIETLELPYKRSLQELGRIDKIFQDKTGSHLIVTTSQLESFYIHKSTTTFKYLQDLKGLKVNVVAWNDFAVEEQNTGAFLIGDRNGGIHEAFLEYSEASQKYSKKIQRDVYKRSSSIDGLQVTYDDANKEVTIILASGDNIAYWHTASMRQNAKYNDLILGEVFKSNPVEIEQYQDLGNINGSKFYGHGNEFAWLTAAGTVFGSITRDKIATQRNIGDLKILLTMELPASNHKFKSVMMTKYHLLLLRGSELFIINKINDELVYHQTLPVSENERFVGLCADYTKSTYWLYSNCNLFEITVDQEEKHIWRSMCENNMFDEALAVTSEVKIRDAIYAQKGEYLIQQGEFIDAARSFALSNKWFETVALKFINAKRQDALLEYFLQKFHVLKSNKNYDFAMQLIMLSSWIVEFYVEQLNELDDLLATEQSIHLEQTISEKTTVEKKFQEFIIDNKDHLDRKTIYEIITAHNRRSELLYYANLINDYDFVLAYWIRLERWEEALNVLLKNNGSEMAYKYSTVLLVNSPKVTVDTWLKLSDLDASKLLPAILTYNKNARRVQSASHHGVRYLLSYIHETKTRDPNVHDTLLFLLISNQSSDQEEFILRYLEEYGSQMNYNPDFILRLCLKFYKIQSATYVYSLLDCYEDAVDLALSHDMVELAIVIADKPDDENLRKFLWMKIAKAKTSKLRPSDQSQVKSVVKGLLDKCELLTIKDLLPLIPDFTSIDDLRDEICTDLENFGTQITKLSHEMNTSLQLNDKIAQQIGTYQEKSQIIHAGEPCSICELLLTSRKFFLFPCGHAFHSDCLVNDILKSNDYATKKRLEFLQKKFIANNKDKKAKFVNSPDVDALLCKRCPLCSDLKIDTIDQPLQAVEGDWDI